MAKNDISQKEVPIPEPEDQIDQASAKKLRPIQKVSSDKDILLKGGLPFFKSVQKGKGLKEPLLFLIRSNKTVDVFEDVKPGVLKVEVGEDDANIILSPQKILSINVGGDYLRAWIAFEKEANPYPLSPKHDAVDLRRILQAVVLAYKNYREKDTMKGWGDFIIKAGIGIAIVMFVYYMFGPKPVPPGVVEANASTAAEIIRANVTAAATVAKPAFISFFGWI